MCDDSFDDTDAKIVCRQLGLPTSNAVFYDGAYYGSGYRRVWLDEVRCSGSESRLEYCTSSGWGVEDCSHGEDVGVDCSKLSKDTRCLSIIFILLISICVGDSSKVDTTVIIAIAVSIPLFVISVVVVVVVLICCRWRLRTSATTAAHVVPQTYQFVDSFTQSRPSAGAGCLPLNVLEEIPSQYPMAIGQPGPGPQPGGVYSPPFGVANMGQ